MGGEEGEFGGGLRHRNSEAAPVFPLIYSINKCCLNSRLGGYVFLRPSSETIHSNLFCSEELHTIYKTHLFHSVNRLIHVSISSPLNFNYFSTFCDWMTV